MDERRVRIEREGNRQGENRPGDNGPGLFEMVLAGVGIGAAIYGVSKLVGIGNQSSDSNNSNVNYLRKDRPNSIHFIEREDKCEAVIRNIESVCKNYPAVGLDCEWTNDWEGNHGEVAVLSICTANGDCWILRLSHWNFMPSSLHNFLNNRNIIKVGVGIDIDKKKLEHYHTLSLCGTVDLRFVAKKMGFETRNLAYLAKEITDITLNKDCDHRQWNDHPLPEDYIDYAAMDAFASVEVMKKFSPSKNDVINKCSPFIDTIFTTDMNNF